MKKGEGKEEKRKEGKRKIENVLKSSFLYICIEFNGVQITFTHLFSPCPFDGREDGLTSLGFSFFHLQNGNGDATLLPGLLRSFREIILIKGLAKCLADNPQSTTAFCGVT